MRRWLLWGFATRAARAAPAPAARIARIAIECGPIWSGPLSPRPGLAYARPMPTKSAHPADRNRAKKNRAARQAAAAQRAAAGGEQPAAGPGAAQRKTAGPAAKPKKERPSLALKTSVLPSAGVGVIVLIIAMQEGAPFWVAVLVGALIAVAIVGMLALKRGLYGN